MGQRNSVSNRSRGSFLETVKQNILPISLYLVDVNNGFKNIYIFYFRGRQEGGEKEREERDRQRNITLLFLLFMHSFVDACMCPDQRSNLQSWHIRMTLQPTELLSQGRFFCFVLFNKFINLHLMNSLLTSPRFSGNSPFSPPGWF